MVIPIIMENKVMTREELIYLGAIQLFAAYETNPPKVGGEPLPTRGLIEEQALEIAE